MDISRRQTDTPGMLEVHAKHASEVDDALTEAIDVVKIAATEHKTGILISRIDAGKYIVRAHPAVPFGMVRQQYEPLDGRQNGSADD